MFQKAVKSKSKLRLAVFGISGGGKTMTSLRVAKGMGGKIAFIDTEHGSASKYADRFEFDVVELEKPFTVDKYIEAIKAAEDQGYDILIIDSLSHAWQQLLEEVEKLANAKYKGNSFRAWGEGTPTQKRFIEALLSFKGHMIATMRSNTEYSVEEGGKGVKRIGTKAEQGKNIEFEFDMLMELTEEHLCHVIKDRTGKFQDAIIDKPDEKFGEQLIAWLNDGDEKPKPRGNKTKVIEYFKTAKSEKDIISAEKNLEKYSWTDSETKEIMTVIENRISQLKEKSA